MLPDYGGCVPKNSFTEDPDKDLPEYLYLPPEHLMLLK